jgi:hypothetical protein
MSSLSVSDRSRSPRYPSHSLDQAIGFSRKIYEGVHRSSTDSLTAVRLMGFAGKSGASATALGSVRQFGLIEGVGENTRISELALKILEPVDVLELAGAIREAANLPTVFAQIDKRFGGRLPPANEPIRAFLIRDLGFSKSGADDCLNALRGTTQYLQAFEIESGKQPENEQQTGGDHVVVPIQASASAQRTLDGENETSLQATESELIMIPLTRECRASLRFHGTVTEKAVANLMRHIDLMKDVWMDE